MVSFTTHQPNEDRLFQRSARAISADQVPAIANSLPSPSHGHGGVVSATSKATIEPCPADANEQDVPDTRSKMFDSFGRQKLKPKPVSVKAAPKKPPKNPAPASESNLQQTANVLNGKRKTLTNTPAQAPAPHPPSTATPVAKYAKVNQQSPEEVSATVASVTQLRQLKSQ